MDFTTDNEEGNQTKRWIEGTDESESSVGKNLERNGKNDKDFGDLSYRRGGVLIVSAASFSASETILKTRRCNQRCTRLPTDYDYSFSREQNFPSSSPLLHSFSLSRSLFSFLFLRFSQFFLATFTPRFARLWHRVRRIFLDSQRESTATTIRLVTRPVPSFLHPRVYTRKYAGRPCTLIHSRPFYRIGRWGPSARRYKRAMAFFFYFSLSFFLSYSSFDEKPGGRGGEVISEGILIGSLRVEAR